MIRSSLIMMSHTLRYSRSISRELYLTASQIKPALARGRGWSTRFEIVSSDKMSSSLSRAAFGKNLIGGGLGDLENNMVTHEIEYPPDLADHP